MLEDLDIPDIFRILCFELWTQHIYLSNIWFVRNFWHWTKTRVSISISFCHTCLCILYFVYLIQVVCQGLNHLLISFLHNIFVIFLDWWFLHIHLTFVWFKCRINWRNLVGLIYIHLILLLVHHLGLSLFRRFFGRTRIVNS